jgi:hypothetical protein
MGWVVADELGEVYGVEYTGETVGFYPHHPSQ